MLGTFFSGLGAGALAGAAAGEVVGKFIYQPTTIALIPAGAISGGVIGAIVAPLVHSFNCQQACAIPTNQKKISQFQEKISQFYETLKERQISKTDVLNCVFFCNRFSMNMLTPQSKKYLDAIFEKFNEIHINKISLEANPDLYEQFRPIDPVLHLYKILAASESGQIENSYLYEYFKEEKKEEKTAGENEVKKQIKSYLCKYLNANNQNLKTAINCGQVQNS
jgi:hypothetical protein